MSQKLIAALRGLSAVVLMLFATNFLPIVAATQSHVAADTDKVFVCKYVGTPGVDETLQTGNNPISVSVSSIKKYAGIKSYFNDAQGRSFVLAVDDNSGHGQQGEPSINDCPAPQGPTHVGIPSPSVNDPCGIGNATWNLPADTASITWTLTNGSLSAHTKAGFAFTDNTTVHNFGTAVDSNVLCPEGPHTVPLPHPDVTDPCGEDNATWVLPSNNAQVTWTLTNGNLVAHTTAGNVFPGGDTSHDFGKAKDSVKECKVFVCKYVGTPGVNERLQTGQNPISVSANSTGGTAVGSFFNDAQGRSFVLAIDNGQPTPDVSLCPAGQGPTEIPTPEVPVVVTCGPNNDVYGNVPTGHYTVTRNGDRSITLTATQGFVFAGNKTSVTLPAPQDNNTVCPPVDVCPNIEGLQTNADDCGSVNGATDVCPNIAGDQATVPTGMTKDAATGNCVTAPITGGTGGDVLGASTTAAPQLANTGQSPWAAVVIGLMSLLSTLGLAVTTRKSAQA
jgi:hypothetical protein